ncbi:hypothetical protein ACOZ06_003588 [Cronobacter muytjensii]
MLRHILFFALCISHAALAQLLAPVSEFTQPQIFTEWVQSRCIASIADSAALKADANASAAAWLEASVLPVEAFNVADAVIAQSADVQALYQQFARQKAQ